MGGRRRGNDEDFERERRPVEPGEARAHGNDPDAVEINRTGDRGREGSTGRTEDVDVRHTEREGYSGSSRGSAAGSRVRSYDEGRQQQGGTELVARRDSVRWGPIWAGLVAALTTFLLLELLALGLGLLTPGDGGGAATGIVSAIIGLIAFFTGGSVAGMTSAVRGSGTGLLNGLMVWALGTVLILLLSVLGLGQLFGALGNLAGQLGPGAIGGAAEGAANNAQNVDPQQAVDAVRTGAIGAFFGLLVSAIAAALGGFLGGRSREPIGRMANDHRGD